MVGLRGGVLIHTCHALSMEVEFEQQVKNGAEQAAFVAWLQWVKF